MKIDLLISYCKENSVDDLILEEMRAVAFYKIVLQPLETHLKRLREDEVEKIIFIAQTRLEELRMGTSSDDWSL